MIVPLNPPFEGIATERFIALATVVDEPELEKTLYEESPEQLSLLLDNKHTGVSEQFRYEILSSYARDRKLVEELNALYKGRCQITGFDSPLLYGVPTTEAHHVVYRSRGGPDELENMVLLSPNMHIDSLICR